MADVPGGVDPAEWRRYVEWRHSDVGMARSQRGIAARACQDVTHTGGSRPFAVLYDEMVIFIYNIILFIILLY